MTIADSSALLLTLAIGCAALLYSAVGHGGASAYLAILALVGASPTVMRPTALLLNLLVAGIGCVQFARAGHLRTRLALPFVAAGVPMAYLGGRIALPEGWYRAILGVVLLLAALRFLATLRAPDATRPTPPIFMALLVGAGLGLLAGLTGVGGGIFLSPLLLVLGWADLRSTAATSALFILANSAAGLAGFLHVGGALPETTWPWVAAAGAGGLIGSSLGAARLESTTLRILLAAVLGVAGLKLLVGG